MEPETRPAHKEIMDHGSFDATTELAHLVTVVAQRP